MSQKDEEKEPNPNVKKVAQALVQGQLNAEASAEAAKIVEKEQGIIAAKGVIYSALRNWTGTKFEDGNPIPITRNGERVGSLPSGLFGFGPVEQVADASRTENRTELQAKAERYQKVADIADDLFQLVAALPGMERASLDLERTMRPSRHSEALEARILREIGNVHSLLASCTMVESSARAEQKSAMEKLKKTKSSAGRPRDEAAYAVAYELAKLYAKVTGRRPTYSEGKNGLSGEYTPALRDVFNALGWKDRTLDGPATAAVTAIKEEDMRHPESTLLGGLLGVPS